MNTPYMVGRRISAKLPAKTDSGTGSLTCSSLRAEDSGKPGSLRTFGWSAVTFGAGAVLGWMAGAKKAGS